MKTLIKKLLKEHFETEYAVIEIKIYLANMDMDYYFQARPMHEVLSDRVYVKKGASGSKSISTKNISVLKTFMIPSQEEEMNLYLKELRDNQKRFFY